MAGKIFVTGDCHSKFKKLNRESFPERNELDKDDYVIICGDFGGLWEKTESKEEKWWLDWLDELKFTVLFVDGNHENFDRLNSYTTEMWNGGKVHKIRESVIHLMRGQVFELAEKKIFTFGGASSHDISGGILDMNDPDFKAKKKELDKGWESYRINRISWWEEELPTEVEMQEALDNLEKNDFKVDYIISHCCSTSTQTVLAGEGLYEEDVLTDFFDEIKEKCSFDKWYFGHYHDNINVNEKEILLYEKIVPLGEIIAVPVIGHPVFKRGDKVTFELMFEGKLERVEGIVEIVDAYGTFEQSEEPSYDIGVMMKGDNWLVKHVIESSLTRC